MRCLFMPAVAATLVLGGCAATVTRPDAGPGGSAAASPVRVPAEASKNIVLNVTGSPVSTGSQDWPALKNEWNTAMASAVSGAGARFSPQEGAPRPTGQPGTLVVVDVSDYRYLSQGARIGLGIFTGNAYVNAKVRYLDLRTGAVFGERTYNTSSSAWQGIFSAMTDKQIAALSQEIVKDISPR